MRKDMISVFLLKVNYLFGVLKHLGDFSMAIMGPSFMQFTSVNIYSVHLLCRLGKAKLQITFVLKRDLVFRGEKKTVLKRDLVFGGKKKTYLCK